MQGACMPHAIGIGVSNAEVMPSNAMHSNAFRGEKPDLIVTLNKRSARDASGQAEAQVMSA